MTMFRKLIFSISVIAFVSFTNETISQTPVSPDSSLQEILNALTGTPLTLDQAVQYALKNATSVRKAEAAFLAAGGSLRKESGQFDPQLFFNLNYLDQS